MIFHGKKADFHCTLYIYTAFCDMSKLLLKMW